MKSKIVSTLLSVSMLASSFAGMMPTAHAAANVPKYQTNARQMERLNRGLIAVYTTADTRGQTVNGVYLSWRLLGTESLENQAFDIYRDDIKIYTTGEHEATNYVDKLGKATSKYKVVPKGENAASFEAVTPYPNNYYAKPSEVGNGNSHKNSFTYMDIPIERPEPVKRMGDGKLSYYYTYDSEHEGGANDASVGDLDGDGDYEIVLKWDPTDSKDSAGADYTGNVYIDAYEIDPNNTAAEGEHLYKWRIDLGKNVTAGAHYTQFMVYDLDGDGKAEVAMKTAPGSKDGLGNYVSLVGDTEAIRNVDNEKAFVGTADNNYLGTGSSRLKGKNPFVQYLTIFDGETGKALYTTDFIPFEGQGDWGDGGYKYNRSERYLAAVAYLDGVHPSLIMCRGYYDNSVLRAYNWDGSELSLLWEHNANKNDAKLLYGQGNHNLSIGDIDNDGFDEIVYGSASLDHDGKTVLGNTGLGHGDAMHMNDFNNDGVQEVFSVKEEKYKTYAEDLRVAATGKHFWASGKITTGSDNGRGVMDNIDDAYAAANPNALALGWSSGLSEVHDLNGDSLKAKPSSAGKGDFCNFLVYWDGDLGRELLDANIIQKYDAANGWTKRFYGPSDGYTLPGATTNNYTKRNPSLVADIWGDWREEIIMSTGKGQDETPTLRIFTSTIPTEYRLTTLMHDSQYRMSVAWQNVAYNQPTHTSYYVGSAALATDESGNKLNYLAPAVAYTKVTYDPPQKMAVTGVTLSETSIRVEKGRTYTLNAAIEPADATVKKMNWTSSDTSVATVSGGVVKAVSEGTATITVETVEGGFTASCEVEVYANAVTGISLSEKVLDIGVGVSKTLKATVYPEEASDKSVIWTSSDEAIATVDGGKVTGQSYGIAKITAETTDGGFKASCIVSVKPIGSVDATGDDVFKFVPENTDANITLDAAANKALLVHKESKSGATVEKNFEVLKQDKAILDMQFVTGGVKIDGANWNWTGHEYTTGLQFLDENGNNILKIYQPWQKSAGKLTSAIKDKAEANVEKSDSGWSVTDGLGNIQGSAKRWNLTAEFDYDNDTCKVTIKAMDSNWVESGGIITQTFKLDGASFKTLRLYTTNDGTGTIVAQPNIRAVSYSKTENVTGTAETVYTKTDAWTQADVDGWVQEGTDTAALAVDESGRVLYNPVKPGAEYSAKKEFAVGDNAIVVYDVDWYFGSAVNRDGNYEYIKFGDVMCFGWTNGYKLNISTDGGATWVDANGDGTPDDIFTGSNTTYTKNIKVAYNTALGTVEQVIFDGSDLLAYKNYKYATEENKPNVNYVSIGFKRVGAPPDWAVPNGVEKLSVSQFVFGDDPVIVGDEYIKSTGKEGAVLNYEYGMTQDSAGTYTIIAAVYSNGALEEFKTKDVAEPDVIDITGKTYTDSFTFEGDIAEKEVKLFIWDSINGMTPICDFGV